MDNSSQDRRRYEGVKLKLTEGKANYQEYNTSWMTYALTNFQGVDALSLNKDTRSQDERRCGFGAGMPLRKKSFS